MRINKLNIALLLGFIVIIGVVILQFFLLRQAVHYEEKKFAQKAHVALLEIANKLNVEGKTALPQTSPIDKISNSYFIVNVNSKFEPSSLSYYLKNEFEKFDLTADYEYGYYDCVKEQMNYAAYTGNEPLKKPFLFTLASNGMSYYFAVHFTNLNNYLYKGLKIWIIFSVVMLVVMVLYGYSAFTLLQQKKYATLQKDFINNMTHEFKTPISSVLIAANYLSNQQSILQHEKLKTYTNIIIQQTNHLNNHVEKVLDLAKSDIKSIELNKTVVPLKSTLLSVVQVVQIKYPLAIIRYDDVTEFSILADEFHFKNVLFNIIENAIKYCAKKPEIVLSTTVHKNLLTLSFIDNGIGIPKQYLQQIFKKFYRVQQAQNNDIKGFGLGLFYVKKICAQHHWNIKVVSDINVGSTVTLIIPIYE